MALKKQTGDDCGEAADDLLWSDPNTESHGFENSYRGRGHLFGQKAASDFLDQTGFAFVIRSHQMCQEGYDYPFGASGGVMTVFSSCNYCGNMNDCGVVFIGEKKMEADYFAPMTEEEAQKRRVIFPEWILEHVSLACPEDSILGELEYHIFDDQLPPTGIV
jgi:protein phosphatase